MAKLTRIARWLAIGALLIPLWGEPGSAHAVPPIRGMSIGHHSDISMPKLARTLKELQGLNVSHVTMIVSWASDNVRSTKIAPRPGHTPKDGKMLRMLALAKRRGLKTILFPFIDIRHRKPLEWRGVIKPKDWNVWWRNYRRFILHYARIAQQAQADVFTVGSELVTTEKDRKRWAALISSVREVYKGKLLYSANWDHYKPVAFWDLVDYVGMTTYYKLTDNNKATVDELVAGWTPIKKKLLAWAKQIKRPLMFTEVGYPSIDGGAIYPWDYTRNAPVDLEEQRRCYKAFVKAWDNVPELAGVVFWDYYGVGGPKSRRYTPRGKPAAAVVRHWYGQK